MESVVSMFFKTFLVAGSAATFSYASATVRRAVSVDDCPGYAALNTQQTASSFTADLTLAGAACNVYGNDLTDLRLQVDYQTGRGLLLNVEDCNQSNKHVITRCHFYTRVDSSLLSPHLFTPCPIEAFDGSLVWAQFFLLAFP